MGALPASTGMTSRFASSAVSIAYQQIVRIIQPAAASGICQRQPIAAYQRNQHLGRARLLRDDFAELGAGLDAFEIHKNFGIAKMLAQTIEQPAGISGTVSPAVTDEYARHGSPGFGYTRN